MNVKAKTIMPPPPPKQTACKSPSAPPLMAGACPALPVSSGAVPKNAYTPGLPKACPPPPPKSSPLVRITRPSCKPEPIHATPATTCEGMEALLDFRALKGLQNPEDLPSEEASLAAVLQNLIHDTPFREEMVSPCANVIFQRGSTETWDDSLSDPETDTCLPFWHRHFPCQQKQRRQV